MKFNLNFNAKENSSDELIIISAFQKTIPAKGKKKEETALVNNHWSKELKEAFAKINISKSFTGTKGEHFYFLADSGAEVLAIGLGVKTKVDFEALRREAATTFKKIVGKYTNVSMNLDGFVLKNKLEDSLYAIVEGMQLSNYGFDKYLSTKRKVTLKEIIFDSAEKKTKLKKAQAAVDEACVMADCVNYGRDLVNETPNFLNSEKYAKLIEQDVKGMKGVKFKALNKAQLKKEKMGLFLSVNAGSAFEPRLVHLTYTPSKVTSKTKHIAFVGKGLTFDTGGYSLKPGGSMVNMKTDMGGSATVYAAFRAAASLGLNVKITCILGMTDNAVNSLATMPDSIVTARNGKTVEILNTDAEGRLVLADCLDYACDQKPDAIIDSATLTGAVLVSLGHEICGLMGTDQKLMDKLLKSGKSTDEYIWQLPIINEFHKDMKSPIADLKNIGGSRFGGSSKAAAFLSNFVKNDIPWAHLDIAGVADGQSHLPYCPAKGASGLMVRTLVDFLKNS
jgi:leucyl aminopeptidase